MPPSIRTEIDLAAKAAGYRKRLDLAAKLNITPSHVSDLMNGNRKFTPEMVQAFVRVLRVPAGAAKRWHQWGAKAAGWKI